jgi:hypothetical protein
MDDLISDAQNKNLFTFEQTGRTSILASIYVATIPLSKINQIDMDIYWKDYIIARKDRCGFLNEEEF